MKYKTCALLLLVTSFGLRAEENTPENPLRSVAPVILQGLGDSAKAVRVKGRFQSNNIDAHGVEIPSQKENFETLASLKPDGKYKIIYSPFITEWHNGAAPYHKEEEITAYDGKTTIEYTIKSGRAGKATPENVAHILKANLGFTSYRYENGLMPFLCYWKVFDVTLPHLMALMADPQRKLSSGILIDLQKTADSATLTITSKFPNTDLHSSKEQFVFSLLPPFKLSAITQELDTSKDGVPNIKAVVEFSDHFPISSSLMCPKTTKLTISYNGVPNMSVELTIDECQIEDDLYEKYTV